MMKMHLEASRWDLANQQVLLPPSCMMEHRCRSELACEVTVFTGQHFDRFKPTNKDSTKNRDYPRRFITVT